MAKVADFMLDLADQVIEILDVTHKEKRRFENGSLWDSVLDYVINFADCCSSPLELAQGFLRFNRDNKGKESKVYPQRVAYRCITPCKQDIPCMVVVSRNDFENPDSVFLRNCLYFLKSFKNEPIPCTWREFELW